MLSLESKLEETKLRVEQLDAVRRTALAITSTSDHAQQLRTIIEHAVELLKGKSGGIYEYYPELKELTVIADSHHQEYVGTTLEVGVGMAGQLVQNNEPYMINDNYSEWEGRAPVYDQDRRFGAVLEVPVQWEDKTIGVLYIDDEVGRKFTKDDADLLKLYADHAAITLLNISLTARDAVRLKRLERLSEVSKEFMSNLGSTSLEDRLIIIAKYAAEILEAEVCGVFRVKEEGFLSLEASYGHREGGFQKGRRFAIRSGPGTGLTGHIAFTGELYNDHGANLYNHPAVRGTEPDCTPSGLCSSLLAIPLKKKTGQDEKLIGLLRAANKKDKNLRALPSLSFTKEDEWILSIFAEAVVIAIDSAALVEELGERTDHQSRLVESSPNGIVSIDREGNIKGFNEKAREALGYGADDQLPALVTDIYFDPLEPHRVGKLLHESKDGKLKNYYTSIRSKDNRAIPIRLSATWLKDAKGECIGSVGYFEDLRTIQEVEKRLKLFLEASDIVARADSLETGLKNLAKMVVSLLSNTFCRILLYDESRSYLTVEAAYPITRPNGGLRWIDGIGHRIDPLEYEGLKEFLEEGKPRVLKLTDEETQPQLKKFSNQLGLMNSEVQSLLLVPLKIDNEVVGLLDVGELRKGRGSSFTEDKIELSAGIAAQISILIKRLKLFEIAERRRQLLTALDDKVRQIRAEDDLKKLQRETVRLAVELIGGASGVLFVNYPRLKKLEPVAAHHCHIDPARSLSHDEGLCGLVARTGKSKIIYDYSNWPEREEVFTHFNFETVIAVPLRRVEGDVAGVLFIAAHKDGTVFTEVELEILERFAEHVSITMRTAQQMGDDHRTSKYLNILQQISEFTVGAQDLNKILAAVLTGVTAGYGLGFNRAVIMLLDDREEHLIGRRGIGHLQSDEAVDAWRGIQDHGSDNFKTYLEYLERNALPTTPVGVWVKSLRLSVRSREGDYFSRAAHSCALFHISAQRLAELPKRFIDGFQPTTELVIAPLFTANKKIGVLVVDNKFNGSQITKANIDVLLRFTNLAAIAIEKHRRFESLRTDNEHLRSLFKASTILSQSKDAKQVLDDIVEQMRVATKAAWVRVILTDESGQVKSSITKGVVKDRYFDDAIRQGGIEERAFQTGTVQTIEDTHNNSRRINPSLLTDNPESLICLPLMLQERKFGLMLIGYSRPRNFAEFEIAALRLYVYQAAVAYDNARRIDVLQKMRQAAEALARANRPRRVLEEIVENARLALQADSAALWTYNAKRKSFVTGGWVASNIAPEIEEEFRKVVPRDNGTARTVMAHEWLPVENINDTERYKFLGASTRNLLGRIGAASFMGIALMVGDEPLGVLYVNFNHPRKFDEEEQQTARTFANHAALTLKNAELLDQAMKAKKAAEAVAKVTVLGDLKATLKAIVSETKEALDCDAVVLFEYDKNTHKLGHPPTMIGVRDEEAAAKHKADPESIIYKMLARDEPEPVDNVLEAPLFKHKRFTIVEGIRSCVAIPLKSDGEKVGVMFVNHRTPHNFTPDELDNIEMFANQAAIAIKNAQLFERQNRRIKRQFELLGFSKTLLGTLKVQETMDQAVAVAAKMLGAECCTIMLPSDDKQYVFSAAYGWNKKYINELRTGVRSQTGYTILKREPVVVADYSTEKRFDVHPVIKGEDLKSGLSVPMFSGDDVIGAMLLHTKEPRHFTEENAQLLQLIANQTAIALQSARQFEKSVKKSNYLNALYEASKAISASFSLNRKNALDRKGVLDQIARQALEGITGIEGSKAVLANILLMDETTNELVFESVYPAEQYPNLVEKIGHGRSLDKDKLEDKRVGVNGRAVLTGKTQLVHNVEIDPDYIEYNSTTKSELSIPLKDKDGKVLGVLNVESDKESGFDDDDRTNLEALAELATIVIKNAEQFQELIETKGMVDASTALARLGMAAADWGHTIRGNAINIRNLLTLMRDEIKPLSLDDQQRQKLEDRFQFIEKLALQIEDKVPVPPLSSEEGVETILISALIPERISQLLKNAASSRIACDLSGIVNSELKIRVSREWFRRALDILVHNSIKAMAHSQERKLTVSSRLVNNQVEIEITDTGEGIPLEYQKKILKERILIPGRNNGLGLGLLHAKAIMQIYKGEITLKRTSNHGTTFVISLPCEK